MDYKKVFEKFEEQDPPAAFVRTTLPKQIEGSQKAALNRKGNVLFNSGDIESARRIFMTTGYSDGMSRVGDYYKSKNRIMDALRMYWMAPDRNKLEPLLMQLAGVLQNIIHEEEEQSDE